jgi:hypothetical protein
MIRRAEELVEIFSTRYIRDGWHENFDKARAAEFLEAVRSFNIAAQDAEHEAKIFAWTQDHGVSLDWLLDGDHKVLIAYHASHAAPPPKPDPIFAAIEKERALREAFHARCRYEDDLADSGVKLESAPDDHRTPEMVAAVDVSVYGRGELAETAPTTLAGMIAYLDYVLAESENLTLPNDELVMFYFDTPEETLAFARYLARSARHIARAV